MTIQNHPAFYWEFQEQNPHLIIYSFILFPDACHLLCLLSFYLYFTCDMTHLCLLSHKESFFFSFSFGYPLNWETLHIDRKLATEWKHRDKIDTLHKTSSFLLQSLVLMKVTLLSSLNVVDEVSILSISTTASDLVQREKESRP